jgi:uncharacterized membrane protein
MRTPASIAGHPIHPMLVPIAIGGFVLSFVFDIVCWASGASSPNVWNQVSYYTMLGGIAGALLAAVPGLIDLLSLPPGPVKSTAIKHMALNLTIVAIYVFNAWKRHASPSDLGLPMLLSLITILALLVSGWLGGKLVFEGGVGVDNAR